MFIGGKCTRILEQVARGYVRIPLCEEAVGWMSRRVQLAIREGHHLLWQSAFSFPHLHLLLKLRVDELIVVKP